MTLLLAHSRAVPMSPGGFLAWPQDTIHWGGLFRRGTERLALSWEFMGAQHENFDDILPLALYVERPLPEFKDRLRWICHYLWKALGRDVVLKRVPAGRASDLGGRTHAVEIEKENGSTTMKPAQHVRANVTDDNLIVLDLVKGQIFTANAIGARIWRALFVEGQPRERLV